MTDHGLVSLLYCRRKSGTKMAGAYRGAELLREAGFPPGPPGQRERSQGLLLGGPETYNEVTDTAPVSTGTKRMPVLEPECPCLDYQFPNYSTD